MKTDRRPPDDSARSVVAPCPALARAPWCLFAALALLSASTSCDTGAASDERILEELRAMNSRLDRLESHLGVEGANITPPDSAGSAGGAPEPTSRVGSAASQATSEAEPGDAATSSVRSAPTVAGPSALVDEPVEDFGEIWAGPVLEHEFVIRNVGSEPLEIRSVDPECGCTVAGDWPRRIAPGASGRFPFRLKTERLRGATRKAIAVETNDPERPELSLVLRADVRPSIDYESFVVLRARPGDGPVEKSQTIRNRRDEPIGIELRPGSHRPFDVSLAELEPGRSWELRLAVAPPYEIGYERSELVLETTLEEQPTLTIRANLHVPARVEVVPKQIVVDRVGPRTRHITLSNYGDSDVRLVSAEVDDPAVEVRQHAKRPGEVYGVQLTFPDGYRPPSSGRSLTLRTDDPEFAEIVIPIRTPAPPQKKTSARRPALDLIGEPAPEIALETLGGLPVSRAAFAQAPATILNFFAPDCGFCKRQIPLVETVRERYEADGVRFVNVSERMRRDFTTDEVLGVLEGIGSRLEVAIDSGNRAGRAFRATSFPTLVVVDRSGEVRDVTIGAKRDLESMLSETLDDLLAAEGG